jgi:hypothetical protein
MPVLVQLGAGTRREGSCEICPVPVTALSHAVGFVLRVLAREVSEGTFVTPAHLPGRSPQPSLVASDLRSRAHAHAVSARRFQKVSA